MNDEFIEKWASVLEEYAVRYGDKVKGWWIDGCYDYFGYTVFYLDDEVEDSIGYCAQAVNKIEHKPKQIIFNIVY